MTVDPADQATVTDLLLRVETGNAKEILSALGVRRVDIRGLHPLGGLIKSVAGPARTLRFMPSREDIAADLRQVSQRKLIEDVQPGQVLVIDAGGNTRGAVLGDMLAARAAHRGVAGVFVDGVVRDLPRLVSLGMPVFARGTSPDPSSPELIPWEIDGAVQCGGRVVFPGDWILADTTALVVIPKSAVGEVALRGAEMAVADDFSQRLLTDGFPLDLAYPVPPILREDLERFKSSGTVPELSEVESRHSG